MGMFDYINCKYKLPEVDLSGTSLTQEDLRVGNQTKDFDNALEEYTIEEDGRISYIAYKDSEWVPPDKDYTGPFTRHGYIKRSNPEAAYVSGNHQVEFGNYVQKNDDEFDYAWDWEATITGGVVTSINFKGLEKICNKERKRLDAEYRKRNKIELEFRKTWQFRFVVKHVRTLRQFIRRKIIKFTEVLTVLAYKI